jgi:gliding-associated putative ABC transporter substrate-binding component GldG
MNRLRPQDSIFLLAAVGSLLLLNLVGLKLFGRFDLTSDREYTLSKASRATLASLEEPITVKAYFTSRLPAPYSGNARYVRDLLEEFRSASKGKLGFEFIDPADAETSEDKATKREVKRDIFGRQFREPTSVEKELAEAGVQPVEIRVVEDDQVQTKRAYLGVVIHYGEKKEVIPVVQDLTSFEYDLTSLIRKLTRTKTPVLAVLQGHDEPKLQEKFQHFQAALSEVYSIKPLDLASNDKIDEDVDALLVLGPKTPLRPNEFKAIDQFLMKGKALGLFLDSVQVDTRSMEAKAADSGLGPLLQSYGVTLGDKLVADVQSAQVSLQERRGFMTVAMPVPYPFVPEVMSPESKSPITKGLSGLAIPFPTQLSAVGAPGRNVTVLARSSRKSWLEGKPFNVDPRRDWQKETITPSGPYDLLVQVSGKLPSHFASEASSSSAGPPLLAESTGDARLIVAGTSALFQDEFLSRTNQALLLNVADWLLLDPSMIEMRTRGLSAAPLKKDLSDGARNLAKYGNAVGIPLLLALYGVLRWRMREARRSSVRV